jgi:hypothetical protein
MKNGPEGPSIVATCAVSLDTAEPVAHASEPALVFQVRLGNPAVSDYAVEPREEVAVVPHIGV